MSERRRRCFRPVLDGHALEERVVLSAASGIVATATAAVDPLNPPTTVVVLSDVFIHAHRTNLPRRSPRSSNSTNGLARTPPRPSPTGRVPPALAGLMLTASIDAGRLETQLQSVGIVACWRPILIQCAARAVAGRHDVSRPIDNELRTRHPLLCAAVHAIKYAGANTCLPVEQRHDS